jgi:hypothetical protein
VGHVVLGEEGETEPPLNLPLEEVEEEGDEGVRQAGLAVDDPPHYFLQGAEGTVQHQLVHYLMVLGREQNSSHRSHAPPPHRQPLHLQVLVRLAQDGLGVCRLVEPVSEESGITVAAPDEIKGDDCDCMFCD